MGAGRRDLFVRPRPDPHHSCHHQVGLLQILLLNRGQYLTHSQCELCYLSFLFRLLFVSLKSESLEQQCHVSREEECFLGLNLRGKPSFLSCLVQLSLSHPRPGPV